MGAVSFDANQRGAQRCSKHAEMTGRKCCSAGQPSRQSTKILRGAVNLVSEMPLDSVFALQNKGAAAQRAGPDYAQRRAMLQALASSIRAHEDAICAALASDFAKPSAEVILTEVLPVLQEIRHALRHLRRWMRPARVPPTLAMLGTAAQVIAQPRGVCLIIAPWNYPFNLTLGPLVSAIAAGNRSILKPSEMTPATSALIAKIVAEVFTPDQVAVVQGGVETAQALLALPFDHIFFTGSPAVGRKVMAAAAQNLASVTLELGGKSPVIIGPSATIAQAAAWVAFGKFGNAGQTCIAPDHVFVHASVQAEFSAALQARIARAYGTGSYSPHLAKVVNAHHASRLHSLLRDALAKGAQVITGGEGAGGENGRAFPPTLISALTPEMHISTQEIFGPILPIIPYDDLDQVMAAINARAKPLALYIFGRSARETAQIIAGTTSGSVGVNLTMAQFSHLGLPFGGVNGSGIGAAHGRAGFDAFSHQRAVLRNIASPLALLFPPYIGRSAKLIQIAKRLLG
jgi:aldehyde dehydrogenase (NAD+)